MLGRLVCARVRVITAAPEPGPSGPFRGSLAATGSIRPFGAGVRPAPSGANNQRATIAIRALKRPAPTMVSPATFDLSTQPLRSKRDARECVARVRMIGLI